MSADTSTLLSFPSGFPSATAGALLKQENVLITGHDNGFVVKWDLKAKSHEIIHNCGSTVKGVSISSKREVAVGCESGLLFTFHLSSPRNQNVIQQAGNTKFTRIWQMRWVSDDSIIIGSTYGVINLFTRSGQEWTLSRLEGHNDSIFGIGGSNDNLVISGDWRGKMIIRQYREGEYDDLDQVRKGGAIYGISIHKDGAFATIDEHGHISFFEKATDPLEWKSVFETDTASSRGRCVLLTDDGKTVYGGTNTELIQIDIETLQVKIIAVTLSRALFSDGEGIIILTTYGLLSLPRSKIDVPASAVKYQYSKVSLIGHTGAGKTTLCNTITTGPKQDVNSTFGKRIWPLTLPGKDGGPERRIVLHDHGGQETVLDTFLPFLADSDIVLIFFQKVDNTTFERAVEIREELASVVTAKTKIFFVETFIDQDMDEIDRHKLKKLISEGTITDCLQVSPAAGTGIEDFKQRLIDAVDWDKTRTMIRSQNVESLEKSISALIEHKTTVMRLPDFKKFHENNSGRDINTEHLKFLLENFSNQGSIEYYPKVVDTIIFNDDTYNKLRSNIPIEVAHKDGIISIKEIEIKFGMHDYVKMLDQLYVSYGLAIANDELRIFPSKLKECIQSISEPYKKQLATPRFRGELAVPIQEIKVGRLLQALSELNLTCIDASTTEGLFAWEKAASVYYKYEQTGDAIKGRYLKFTFTVGGESEPRSIRLQSEFENLVDRLYGPRLQLEESDSKKKDLKTLTFDVALSFAGEQRDYVFKVYSFLAKKGINVFYDELYESHLWGSSLTEYLHRIFYSQARWCIMFISKEYIEKIWPTHERKSALARQVEVKGGYILPVRFDDTIVPGLPTDLRYENANNKTPEQLGEVFLKKFEEENTAST